MAFTYRRLRKSFFRAKRAHQALARHGAFTLRLAGTGEPPTMTAEFKTPHEGEAIRFALLMRTFLDPDSEYHYRRVWGEIQQESTALVPDELRAAVEREITDLERGDLPVHVDGQPLTPATIYRLIADAGFFDERADATAELERLQAKSMPGPLLWYQFYSLNISVYHFLEQLYPLARNIERAQPQAQPSTPICLFCLRSDGPFTSEEHVLPEALGNDDTVLPPGSLCDPCNGILSTVEQPLVELAPIAALRVIYVPHGKHGDLPTARFADGNWAKTGPRSIEIHSQNLIHRQDGNRFEFEVTARDTKPFRPHVIARAVMKIALEMIAYRWGHEAALAEIYHPARRFIIGHERTFPGVLLTGRKAEPRPSIETTISRGSGTPCKVDIFGVIFGFALEAGPSSAPKLPPEVPFDCFDLRVDPRPGKRRAG